jgi:hypothetical protein
MGDVLSCAKHTDATAINNVRVFNFAGEVICRPFIAFCHCRVENKNGKIRRVKRWHVHLVTLALSASMALAEDFKTINGKVYEDATVSRVEADGLVLKTKGGIVKVYFVELPKEVADKWIPPEQKERIAAEQAAEKKRIEVQKAAERERAEKEKNAEADLNQSKVKFQAAEQRASQAYQTAKKGTVAGQVFVSSRGGENFKLGAVEVGLFARDAVDALLAGLKTYADIKIQELTRSANAPPETTAEQREILDKRDSYYSGSFYFSYLQSAIQTAETDADGKFIIEVPLTGAFVIAAQARRSVGDTTEYYYWLQPVSLEGQQQLTQNLSNNNLTSTTGSSSLIHTQD